MSIAKRAATGATVAALLVTLAGCPGGGPTSPNPPPGQGPSALPATVAVNPSGQLGPLHNPARYHNQADHTLALRPKQEQLVEALHPRVTRAWINPRRYYDATNGSYTYDYPSASANTAYGYLDQVARYTDQMMVNIGQCQDSLMTLSAPQTCRQVLKNGLTHYKRRYPKLRYVELFNEPDRNWEPEPGDPRALSVDEYYRWYQIGYAVVDEVNAELHPDVPLRIGGPVSYTFNRTYLERFIALYAADTDPAKRLDFIAYHQYRARDNPAAVATEKATVRGWLTAHGLAPDIPVFVTEYGVFPGANSGTTFETDLLTQAAAMATLGYYYATSGMDMVMHWVFDHPSNDRKSMFPDGTDGSVYPYYNLVAMQRMLKPTLVAAVSDALSPKGLGVHGLATADRTGIAVLVTNYQWTTDGPAYRVTVSLENRPTEFAGRRVRVQRYLVDQTTSNYAHDRAHDGLQQVEQYVLDQAARQVRPFPLRPNAMSLLVLTPER